MQTIKSGDTAIVFSSTLVKVDSEESWDLIGATVYFLLKRGTYTFAIEAEVVSTTDKTVRYAIGETDDFPTEPGRYSQEWKVIFSDNSILRFPNDSYNSFYIKDNLGDEEAITSGIGAWIIGSTFIVG